jgi:3',5'-cyclic AMP phosphodiesterase CpdA
LHVRCATALAFGFALELAAGGLRAELSGVVYVDANASGAADAGEGRAGVVVSNGRDVVRSGADGRYVLPEHGDFVFVTLPRGFDAEPWYRAGGGDFALVPRPDPDEFLFAQISDAHVYRDAADFAAYSAPFGSWVPEPVADWLALRLMLLNYVEESDEELYDPLRGALAPYVPVSALEGRALLRAYVDEFLRPGSALGRVEDAARAAFAEVAALGPAFVVSTGDLVLEGNRASPEAIERWLDFYLELARGTGLRFYDTIGNNEIAGNQSDDFASDDPRFGKGAFRARIGPTHYSFDRGDLHFVALDTHRRAPGFFDEKRFVYTELEPDVREWADADLAAHADRVLVVLNHEPLAHEQGWRFLGDPVDDQGLLERHRVPYALAGHVHRNGLVQQGPTTHVITGALSGMRWMLPAGVHARGYRLLYARDGKLWHAWKELGKPVVELLDVLPSGDGVAFVAADRSGAFAALEATLDGAPVELEHWGAYFGAARVPAQAVRAAGSTLALRATSHSGESRSVERGLEPVAR